MPTPAARALFHGKPGDDGPDDESAGYEDVSFTRVDEKIMIGTTVEECIAFALAIGPAGEVFREAGRNSPSEASP